MRWTARRKRELLMAAREAPERTFHILAANGISSAEFEQWSRQFDAHGLLGLKTTKLQKLGAADRGRSVPEHRKRG